MDKLRATPQISGAELKALMHTYVTTNGRRLINQTVQVVDENDRFRAALLKGEVPIELQQAARAGFARAHEDFSNRGSVVGKAAMMPRLKKDGTLSSRRAVPASILKLLGKTGQLGSFDRVDRTGQLVCRQSNWTLNDPEVFVVARPLVEWATDLFRLHCPVQFATQMFAVNSIPPEHRIGDAAFCNLTVNIDARTALHVDRGDLPGGIAALLVDGDFKGGHLILPRYNLAFNVRAGDILLFDPHEPHANAPRSGNSLSAVLYNRGKLHQCHGGKAIKN